jgi:hypothetical protein
MDVHSADETLDFIIHNQRSGLGVLRGSYYMTDEPEELAACEHMCEQDLLIRLDKVPGLQQFPNATYAYTSNDPAGITSAKLAYSELLSPMRF